MGLLILSLGVLISVTLESDPIVLKLRLAMQKIY